MDNLTASEALFGFMAWLTTREEESIFSAKHNAAPACDLIAEFCEVNKLAEPREQWTKNFTMPIKVTTS